MNERMTKRDTDGQAMMDCEKCKPYYPPAESYLNKQFIFPMETGGAK